MQHAPSTRMIRAAAEIAKQAVLLEGQPRTLIVTPDRVQYEAPSEGPWATVRVTLTPKGTRTVIETHLC
jgi:hypothetical protein